MKRSSVESTRGAFGMDWPDERVIGGAPAEAEVWTRGAAGASGSEKGLTSRR